MSFHVPTEMKIIFEMKKHLHTAEGMTTSTGAVAIVGRGETLPSHQLFCSVFFPTPSAGHSGAVCCVSANFLRKWAVSGSDDGTLRLWLLGGI